MSADLHAIDAPLAESVIAKLESALDLARTGAIAAVAIAVVNRDGSIDRAWSDTPNVGTLLGSVQRLAHKLNLEMDG